MSHRISAPPSIELLRSLFDYDPKTGVITRKITVSYNSKAGDVVGFDDGKGYLRVCISGRPYLCHRVAWAIAHGEWPALAIDHRNGIRSDNRIDNLRQATHVENGQNQRKAQRGSKSGLLGAYIEPRTGRYYSQIKVDGRIRKLGSFASAIDAHMAYVAAKQRLHPFSTLEQNA